MAGRTPTSPASSHYRLMKAIITTNFADAKVDPTPKELDRVARVFVRAGGSWEKLAKGSVGDLALLRRVIKVAVEKGYLTKSPKWG